MTDSTPKPLGEQNYEQFADRYAALAETKAHNAYYERPATLSLLPDVRGLRVLDVGCGAGFALERVLEPQPTEGFKTDERQAHHYEELMREPGFLCIRARKSNG